MILQHVFRRLAIAIGITLLTNAAFAQSFTDVATTDAFNDAVEAMKSAGITSGCAVSPPMFCPNQTITRAEMAAFVIKAWSKRVNGSIDGFSLASETPYFTDVPSSNVFFRYIQKLKELGITGGCYASPARFCPDQTQVGNGFLANFASAIFTVRAKNLADNGCLDRTTSACINIDPDTSQDPSSATSTPYYSDVPNSYTYFKWIQVAAKFGAVSPFVPVPSCPSGMTCYVPTGYPTTTECSTIGQFCPESNTTRGQMAMFVHKLIMSAFAKFVSPAASTTVPTDQPVTVSWAGGSEGASYRLIIEYPNGLGQTFFPGPGVTSRAVTIPSSQSTSYVILKLLTVANGVPLYDHEQYQVINLVTALPSASTCSPSDCGAPSFTDVSLPNIFQYHDSQPLQPQNGLYTLQLPSSTDISASVPPVIDGTFPSTGLPDAPYWWQDCQIDGSCTLNLAGVNRVATIPEIRYSYVVPKNSATSNWFRGIQFQGKITGVPYQTTADAAVFVSNGINFSGGLEYGFRLTDGKANGIEFYYVANANCNCPSGYPCVGAGPGYPGATECKRSNNGLAPLVSELGEEIPVPATLGTEYIFRAWIYWDTAFMKYMFKVDILDASTLTSICTAGTRCSSPIEPTFKIENLAGGDTYASWGQYYAKVARNPYSTTADTTPSPSLVISSFKIAK